MALLLLLLLPLVGSALLFLLPQRAPLLRTAAAGTVLAQLLVALLEGAGHAPAIDLAWLPRLGLAFSLSLDGLSLPLTLLTALVSAMAILATPDDQTRPRLFQSLVLATNLGLVTAFLAGNALLFLLATELILIPCTLLVAIWGGERRAVAAIRYLMFGAVSGVCILGGVLALGWLNPAGPSFDYATISAAAISPTAGRWIMALLLLGFAIKMPVVPVHGWQPLAYSESPAPVAMLLSGAASKLGIYGLLRFGVGFLPETWAAWSPWIAAIGAISAVYGALNAIAQSDMRRLVAYGSLGHMGLLLLGMASATAMSLQGVMAQVLAHGAISALLFLLVGLMQRKTGSSRIPDLAGLLNPYRGLPFTMGLFLLALMASAGIPGLAGFVGEFLLFEGSWTSFPVPTLVCLVASGFTAVYAVRLFNRVGFGRLDNERVDYPNTTLFERVPAVTLTVLVVIGGIWPGLLVGWSEAETGALALRPLPFAPLIAAAPAAPSPTLPS